MHKSQDLSGIRFGRLVAIKRSESGKRQTTWECQCDCGNKSNASASQLHRGVRKSCGCITRTHGLSGHLLKVTHANMMSRCYNPGDTRYKNYGDRGITVQAELHSLPAFVELITRHLGDRPAGMSLDRRDNDLGYELSNLRWASAAEQARNTRSNRYYTYLGKTQLLADWSKQTGILCSTLYNRLGTLGWTVERALSTPGGKGTPRKSKAPAPTST